MKRGFTLIEVLATTALAALFLLAGFKVIAALGRTHAAQVKAESLRSHASESVDLIAWDLGNARYYKSIGGETTLTGYCGLDPFTLAPTHRPVSVRYFVASAGNRNWLVREQSDLDVSTNRNKWSTLVCSGVARLEFTRPADEPSALPAGRQLSPRVATSRLSRADRTGWDGPERGLSQPYDEVVLPGRLRVLLTPDGPAGTSADKVVYTR